MRTRRRSIRTLLCALFVWTLTAGSAHAIPQTYQFESGLFSLLASTGGEVLATSGSSSLDGLAVVIDVAENRIDSMVLTSAGPVSFTLNDPYAGYDEISLANITLSGGPGDLTFFAAIPPTTVYTYTIDPLDFSADVSATSSVPGPPDMSDVPVSSSTAGGGTLYHNPDASALFLNGITIGTLGPFGNEADPIVLKADFVFVGSGVIPEPHGVALMSVGVLVVTLLGRRLIRS